MPILALPRSACHQLLASPWTPWDPSFAPPLHWLDRAAIEDDPAWQQVIPYAVLIDLQGRPWAYRRTGGDGRLRERRSIGVGGHVEAEDDRGGLLATVRAALVRELTEELITIPPTMTNHVPPVAWINEQDTTIGRVHLGLVFLIPWTLPEPPQPRPGQGLEGLGFVEGVSIRADHAYEAWSVLALQVMTPTPSRTTP